MKAGLVVLASHKLSSHKSVGKHSTHQHEEPLVVLKGRAEMIFKDKPPLPAEANHARLLSATNRA
jgi:mannose-6-phosphate isomerase-like protein (cupin superfamily)